jgi:hypothetical protein
MTSGAMGRNWWNIGLWAAQILLALAFGAAGFLKTLTPVADLGTMMNWVTVTPEWLVRFIGVVEFAGAAGMILPAGTRVLPWLTPLAALGFAWRVRSWSSGAAGARRRSRRAPRPPGTAANGPV